MKKMLSILFVTIFWFDTGHGQENLALKIGDQLPKEIWQMQLKIVNDPNGRKNITLGDYSGKLIILDFWATWCGSCITAMQKTHPLRIRFKDSLAIIPVTSESADKVSKFLVKNEILKQLNLISVVSDSSFTKIFPHISLPHYIWISADGKYISQASSDFITSANISKVLKGGVPNWQEKNDVDMSKPLFLGDKLPPDIKINYYSIFLEGNITGLTGGFGSIYPEKPRDIYYSNYPLRNMYRHIGAKLMTSKGIKDSFEKRFLMEVGQNDPINNETPYTYQYIAPANQVKLLYSNALSTLNNSSGYYGRLEKRQVEHFILEYTDGSDRMITKSSKSVNQLTDQYLNIRNCPIGTLIGRINQLFPKEAIILDATNYNGKIDVNLKLPIVTLEELGNQLSSYGLKLKRSDAMIEVFVLSKGNLSN